MAVDAEEAPKEFFFLHIKCSNSFTTRFSCASMLRCSCFVFIRQCFEHGLISAWKREELEKCIRSEEFYREIREQMTKFTKPLRQHDKNPAVLLRAAVSRVNQKIWSFNLFIIFRLQVQQRRNQMDSTLCVRFRRWFIQMKQFWTGTAV